MQTNIGLQTDSTLLDYIIGLIVAQVSFVHNNLEEKNIRFGVAKHLSTHIEKRCDWVCQVQNLVK